MLKGHHFLFFSHNFPTKRRIQFPDSPFWIKLIQIKISYIQKIHYTCNFFVNFWWYLTLRSYKVIVHWWYPIFTQLNYWIFYVFDRSSFEDKTGKKIGGGCSYWNRNYSFLHEGDILCKCTCAINVLSLDTYCVHVLIHSVNVP